MADQTKRHQILGCDVGQDSVVIFDSRSGTTRTVDNAPDALQHALTETDGVTRLDLVHSGWDDLVPDEEHVRERHDQGWDYLLGQRLRELLEK